MSSANRGAKRSERDFYATPEFAFKLILPLLPTEVNYWEPACGDGRLVQWLQESGRKATGTDLALGNDFLADNTPREFILTNPPFSLGLEFCQHARKLAPEVMFLLPLNFLGARYRRAWFVENEPNAIFCIVPRPSFGLNKHGKKGTDSNEYGWFYWGHRWSGIKHPLPDITPSNTQK